MTAKIECPQWYVEITKEIALVEAKRAKEKSDIDKKYDAIRKEISDLVSEVRKVCPHAGVIYRYDPNYYHGSSCDHLYCGDCLAHLDYHQYGTRPTVTLHNQQQVDKLYNLVNPVLR